MFLFFLQKCIFFVYYKSKKGVIENGRQINEDERIC